MGGATAAYSCIRPKQPSPGGMLKLLTRPPTWSTCPVQPHGRWDRDLRRFPQIPLCRTGGQSPRRSILGFFLFRWESGLNSNPRGTVSNCPGCSYYHGRHGQRPRDTGCFLGEGARRERLGIALRVGSQDNLRRVPVEVPAPRAGRSAAARPPKLFVPPFGRQTVPLKAPLAERPEASLFRASHRQKRTKRANTCYSNSRSPL